MQTIRSNTIANGFKVIHTTDKSLPLISLMLYVKVGSNREASEEAGFSHFVEHMVFKSTRKFPDNRITAHASYLGSQMNAFTDHDSTCYWITLPSEYTRKGLEILAELVRYPEFREMDFSFERNVIIEELKQYENDPEENLLEEIPIHCFKTNPLRFPIIGNEASLKAATPAMLQDFHRKWYRPGNAFLVVAGDFDSEALDQSITEFFGDWEPAPVPEPVFDPEGLADGITFRALESRITQPVIALVMPELSDRDPDTHANDLLMKAFAYGKTCRLYERLFLKEKLVTVIKSHSIGGLQAGIAVIFLYPAQDAELSTIVGIFHEEMEKICQWGLDHDEIDREKREMLFAHRYSEEYMESLAQSIASEELASDWEAFLHFPERVNALGEAEIARVAKRLFDPAKLKIFHIGPEAPTPDQALSMIGRKVNNTRQIDNEADHFEGRLPSGMRVFMKRVTGKPTIGISLATEVSQLNETPGNGTGYGNRGVNLLTSNLMTNATEKRDYRQQIEYCAHRGIVLGVSNHIESTSLRCKCFTETLPAALELIADTLHTPTFPDDLFRKQQKALAESIDRQKDRPQQYAAKLSREMMFGKHSNLLGRMGSKADLRHLTRKRLQDWHTEHYQPGRMVMAIVGDIRYEAVWDQLTALFGSDPTAGDTPGQTIIRTDPGEYYRCRNTGLSQAIIDVNGFGCPSTDFAKSITSYMLSYIIGGDMNTRLVEELREKRGLAYTVNFDFTSIRQMGMFSGFAIVDRKTETKTIAAIREVLKDIAANGVTDLELETARNAIRGMRLMEQESVMSQAQTIATLILLGFGYDHFLQRDQRLRMVTRDDIQAVAAEYFQPDNLYFHVLK